MTLERRIRIIDMFARYIRGRVLEWGCQHGGDSCIFHARFGKTVELFGCDIVPDGAYKPFHEFSGLRYTQLNHPYRLDYDAEFFDVVTSNGVLEHVPSDRDSLREIHRVLKPDGTFVLSCLPNRYSYTEAFGRYRGLGHDRLYSVSQAKKMLREAGFCVMSAAYFLMIPTMLLGYGKPVQMVYEKLVGPVAWKVNDVLEHVWPLNRLASNLMLIATKSR